MPLKKRNFVQPVADDSTHINIDGDKNELDPRRLSYAGMTIRDSAGRRIKASELNSCLVIDRRGFHLKALPPESASSQPELVSNRDPTLLKSPKVEAMALPATRAPKREGLPNAMRPNEDKFMTVLESSEVIAEIKAVQQEANDTTTILPWYTRDYEPDEMELMGDTELNQFVDEFYDEPAGELIETAPPNIWTAEAYFDPRTRSNHLSGCEGQDGSLAPTLPFNIETHVRRMSARLHAQEPAAAKQEASFNIDQEHPSSVPSELDRFNIGDYLIDDEL